MAAERQRDPVSRTIEALSWIICDAGPVFGVREMAAALNVLPSSAHRVMTALALKKLVRQEQDSGRYAIGLDMLRLAHATLGRFPLNRIAMPHLQRLVETCDETVLLGMYDADRRQMLFSAAVESSSPLRYVVKLHEWLPLHLGASGLGILAFLPDAVRESVIADSSDASSDDRLRSCLEARISKVRQDGFAQSFGQRVAGAVGFAAPIFSPLGRVVGDVCITLPEQRYSDQRRETLAQLVMQCARSISREMDGSVQQTPMSVTGAAEVLTAGSVPLLPRAS